MKFKMETLEPAPNQPGAIRIQFYQYADFLDFLGGFKSGRRIFEGSGTVWREVETGRRAGGAIESFLNSTEARARISGAHPDQTPGGWRKVPDKCVLHVWKRPKGCEDCKDSPEPELKVGPDFYEENGEPCCTCGRVYRYSHTLISHPGTK